VQEVYATFSTPKYAGAGHHLRISGAMAVRPDTAAMPVERSISDIAGTGMPPGSLIGRSVEVVPPVQPPLGRWLDSAMPAATGTLGAVPATMAGGL
jgi:hypothetical protein